MQLSALVLLRDISFPDRCWKYNTAWKKQSRRFLVCMEDKFLMQRVREPTWEDVLLDLMFTNRELVGDLEFGCCLGHSDRKW